MQEQTLQLEQQSKLKVSGGLVLPARPVAERGGHAQERDASFRHG